MCFESRSLLHADSTNDLHDELFKFLHQFQSVFDSTSIMHIQNWPSEQNEKQVSFQFLCFLKVSQNTADYICIVVAFHSFFWIQRIHFAS